MGAHIVDGEFQSDKYPTCPRGKVPLSVKDRSAQDLLWEYAQRRRSVDTEFASDLEDALVAAGFPVAYAIRVTRGGESRIEGSAYGFVEEANEAAVVLLANATCSFVFEVVRIPYTVS